MKSFKKIALAVVAAMTMGTLIATPASAAPMTVAVDLAGTPNTTASALATPAQLPLPIDNEINAADALKFVATVDTGTAVTVTATNATIVSALHTSTAPVTASSGSSSLTIATGTGTTATFYVYTKTTAVGTVVVNNQGTTLTYYVQGDVASTKIHTLAVSAPANGAAGTKQTITVTATDVFGNKVPSKSITGRVFGSGGTLDTTTAVTGSTLATFGVAEFKLNLPTTSSRSLVEFSLTTASDGVNTVTPVVGFAVPALAPYAEVAVRDLAAELAKAQADLAAEKAARAADKLVADNAATKAAADLVTANAEIAKLKAEAVVAKAAADKALADAIAKATADAAAAKVASDKAIADMKKAFNKLARSWNKKNPKAKVALVK